MIPRIIHSIVVCLALLVLPYVAVSCGGDEPSSSGNGEATLLMNIEPLGQSRAGASGLLSNEKMRSVRVIVLHADGTVEHNRPFTLEGAQAQKRILLKVTPGEKKKIFLFANEESVASVEGVSDENLSLTDFFDGFSDGDAGLESAVNALYYAPDFTEDKPIPMSSEYEIDFPSKGNFDGTFYVVRVATKFTVNFRNMRGEDVTVESFSIARHADKNYLMAHVGNSEQNLKLFNGKTWIEWLKEVSEASSENDDYSVTEAAGWLKDYELPSQADKTKTYTQEQPINVGKGDLQTSKPGEASACFYLPESKNLKAGAADGEQEYTMTVAVGGVADPFVFALPNLKSLFRNTHVIVNISFNKDTSITAVIFVRPWNVVSHPTIII